MCGLLHSRQNFMMKYGSYEKYISICSQSFLCSGWNCIKIEPLQDQYAFLPACLCWLHENHTIKGREELKVVDGVFFLDFLWQWDKEGNCLCSSQWRQQSKDFVLWFLVRKFFPLLRKFELMALSVCRVWSLLEIYDQFPMGVFLMLILLLRRQGALDAVVSERTDLK